MKLDFIFVVWYVTFRYESHECIHSQIAKMIDPLQELVTENRMFNNSKTASDRRLLQNSSFRPIKFYLDFNNLNTTDNKTLTYIKEVLATEVIRRLQDFLMVNGPKVIPPFSKTSCDSFTNIPEYFPRMKRMLI